MKFIIASLPRCGSTAVYRVLRSDPVVRISYEPPFSDPDLNLGTMRKRALGYLRHADGLKHVWDPNGWPFRNVEHISTVDVLARSDELISINRALLECADKIVWLRRRNVFERTISDLWGQQTSLWGHDPDRPHDHSEVQAYRAAALRHLPSPIDPDVFGWYMRNSEQWEDAIVRGLPTSDAKAFYYEDLFGPPSDRLSRWHELYEWLGLRPDLLSPQVQKIISPESKLNAIEIYERIPNFRELKLSFWRAGQGQ